MATAAINEIDARSFVTTDRRHFWASYIERAKQVGGLLPGAYVLEGAVVWMCEDGLPAALPAARLADSSIDIQKDSTVWVEAVSGDWWSWFDRSWRWFWRLPLLTVRQRTAVIERNEDGLIITYAAHFRGATGAALCNGLGEIVGIVTNRTKAGNLVATPVEEIKRLVDQTRVRRQIDQLHR